MNIFKQSGWAWGGGMVEEHKYNHENKSEELELFFLNHNFDFAKKCKNRNR